jgi:hypothetical protein
VTARALPELKAVNRKAVRAKFQAATQRNVRGPRIIKPGSVEPRTRRHEEMLQMMDIANSEACRATLIPYLNGRADEARARARVSLNNPAESAHALGYEDGLRDLVTQLKEWSGQPANPADPPKE